MYPDRSSCMNFSANGSMVLQISVIFAWHFSKQEFHIGLPKMNGLLRIGLPKEHGRFCMVSVL